jgi:hypothetical protein
MPPIRRIVTGIDAEGRSFIEQDGPSPAEFSSPARPGYRMTNLWRTTGAATFKDADSITEHRGVLPPKGGTVIRIIEWPPEPADPEQMRELMAQTFRAMYPDAHHNPRAGEHPGMHQTNSVDYALVMEGEIVAILDDGETLMRQGDVLIQRGTNHAWSNRSGKPVKVAFILVDAGAATAA